MTHEIKLSFAHNNIVSAKGPGGARLLFRAVMIILIGLMSGSVGAETSKIMVGEFSAGKLDGWEEKEFVGSTTYGIREVDDQKILAAESKAAASGLFKKMSVNLDKTPYLNWRWKVGNILAGLDEKTKAGDDFPARDYVVHSGFFFWQTIAVNYVWSGNNDKDQSWPNPFTSNAYMYAVDSGESGINQWRQYKRNVKEDFKAMHGKDISKIDVIAVMTDTDNSAMSASALYGDIYFTKD